MLEPWAPEKEALKTVIPVRQALSNIQFTNPSSRMSAYGISGKLELKQPPQEATVILPVCWTLGFDKPVGSLTFFATLVMFEGLSKPSYILDYWSSDRV